MNLFPWFLFAHVLGAIIAFGPTFSFPIIGRLGAQERTHGNFATRLSLALLARAGRAFRHPPGRHGRRAGHHRQHRRPEQPWLMIAIVLYLIAIGFALFVQTPTVEADHRDDDGRRRQAPAGSRCGRRRT